MNSFWLSIGSSFVISLVSVGAIGVFLLWKKMQKEELLTMVGLATGALLGDAFLHLIPESVELNGGKNSGLLTIGGMLIFFSLEKFLKWRHCHESDCRPEKKLAGISLLADGVHNLIDGLIIGASFMSSVNLGLITSLAVLLHEIPQEIGDIAILIHSGYGLKRAMWLNFLSGILSVLGVVVVWLIGGDKIQNILIPLTAGGFVYLAASDLIPELHRHESRFRESVWQLVTVSIGVVMLFLVR